MLRITVYGKPDCSLCDEAECALRELQQEFVFEIVKVDISDDPVRLRDMGTDIPVIEADGVRLFRWRVAPKAMRQFLERNT